MERPRNTISFSSYIEEQYWRTYIDLNLEKISISNTNQGSIFHGSIVDFKELEKIKSKHADKIYESILRMSEDLMKILTKK
jgi:hypothetical protein